MGLNSAQIVILCTIWLVYGLVHSITASLTLKRWVARRWPACMPLYRLAFNLLALVALIPPLLLIYRWQGDWLWRWTGAGWYVANGLALAAIGGFAWSLRYYDGAEFVGLRQWRERETQVEDQERFYISPLHRFVRHPWYFLGLVILWTRDMDKVFLVSSLMITGYFIIGSRLEERKLLIYHGEPYRRYRERVAALFPLPGRYLTKEQAKALTGDLTD
ncbi:methyltransferase family protein [Sedimenticola sp.]|uniref:methyltransferase family protein n=1 Tax=Sedimenticola sp. TaxID=1940285 RepID=UPI003D11894F